MNFKKEINSHITAEVHNRGKVFCFAKLADGNWVAVTDGSLDSVEINRADFESMLKTLESIGADIRFTNHSAA